MCARRAHRQTGSRPLETIGHLDADRGLYIRHVLPRVQLWPCNCRISVRVSSLVDRARQDLSHSSAQARCNDGAPLTPRWHPAHAYPTFLGTSAITGNEPGIAAAPVSCYNAIVRMRMHLSRSVRPHKRMNKYEVSL